MGWLKKILGIKSNKNNYVAPAPVVAAPSPVTVSDVQTSTADNNVMAKGKRRLTINQNGIGTGVNI